MSTSAAASKDYGTGEKKLSIYIVGLVLCVLLTLIPFAAVIYGHYSPGQKILIVFSSAFLQFIVQVICFLRLNYSTEQARMNMMSFVLAIFILFVVIGGSLWIMWSLDYHMAL